MDLFSHEIYENGRRQYRSARAGEPERRADYRSVQEIEGKLGEVVHVKCLKDSKRCRTLTPASSSRCPEVASRENSVFNLHRISLALI